MLDLVFNGGVVVEEGIWGDGGEEIDEEIGFWGVG